MIVSTAHRHRIDGTPRAGFLAELVAARPAIVVGGAHGKTTTAGMIAFVLAETGNDPSWIIGGVIPQLGGNAGVGDGWLVVEGDESDRSIGELRPQIAVITNVELDHHATYGSLSELEAFFDAWLATVPHVVRSTELEPVELELAVPGAHNRQNAAAALAALELAGVPRADAEAAHRPLHGRRAPLRARGREGRGGRLRRLRPQPDGARGDAADGTRADGRKADRRLPAARLRAHAAPAPRARRGARAGGHGDRDGGHRRTRRAARRRRRQARASTRCPPACGRAGRRPWTTPRASRSPGRVPETSSSRSAWGSPGRSRRRSWRVCRHELRAGRGALPLHDDRHRRPRAGLRGAPDAGRARAGSAGGRRGRTGRGDGGPGIEPARCGRGRRPARPAARRRARGGALRRRPARGGRRRHERRLPAPRPCGRSRRLRVRVRDPRHRRRRRLDERRRLRQRLEGRSSFVPSSPPRRAPPG